MRIDAHAHFAPAAYHTRLQRYPVGATVPAWSRELTEAAMARYQVDATVLSAAAGVYFGDQAEANELARLVNETAAELVRADAARFAALASLPLPDVAAALVELEYALDVLGLDGVVLLSSVGGTHIGEEPFAPLLDELDRRGAYVFVHPAVPADLPTYAYPPWIVELPFESTRAALSLLYSGTLARCPNIRFQLGHLGGALPFLAHRVASYVERVPELRDVVPDGPIAYLSRFYLDTALSLNPASVANALALVSPDRLVFGTDWPYLPDASIDLTGTGIEIDANAACLVPRLRSVGFR
jgi:predicted TIM-barrel fold metal-dependent hydrolase